MKNEMTLTGALLFLISSIPLALWRAYVIARLWAWYMVPLGVPAVGVVQAYGVSLVIGIVTGAAYRDATKREAEDDAAIVKRIVGVAVMSGFALLFGWAFYQFK